MTNNYKKILIPMVSAAAICALASAVVAKEVSSEAIEAAQEKTRTILDRVMPSTQNVDVQPRVPNIPSVSAQGMDEKILNQKDPFVVAERVRQSSGNLAFDPNDADNAQLMVFVSFSMPEASLNRLALETAKVGGVLVLRGFVNDSLKQTVAASEKMTNLGAQLEINPQLYQEYSVNKVPSYVIAKRSMDASPCSGGTQCVNHLKLEGDASLHAVLDRFSQNKNQTMANIAGAKLAIMESR